MFEKEMGDKWLNVTWRVTIARDSTRALCQLLQAWKPKSGRWRHWQDLLYQDAFGSIGYWHSIEWERNRVPSEPVFLEETEDIAILRLS
jgi:hypothetical protein